MDAQLKAKWVEALRSGKYEQAIGRLRRDEGFCCLGVLCQVAALPITPDGDRVEGVSSLEDGYKPLYGLLGNSTLSRDLYTRNDGLRGHRQHSFAEIADYIEAHL